MSDTTINKPATSLTANPSSAVATAPASLLVTEHGKTTISDAVVAKIAGIATREVSGVHALGGSTARAVGALRERIPGGRINHSQGVSVEVGEREAAVDLELVAEYGVSITDLSAGIRRNVILAIERMTGLAVTEVNIVIQDVYLPADDEDGDDTGDAPRVQ
ncbi:Asp23/Gls24 family envelope stress response protein [Pengzhenrongella frigida]|uniref:Asp23/Gls24 family envelope stress response protein n=1 Tax=Pengzhenrongella frigida TaxID=1259133 RepID=A0A4Q5MYS8_9MICO|nr:Asp23/Gls24 family envelope stress response protein [Cellulomonas sp. HLT2-17]RYV50839.1 Asp23/Gls24 family envelope stress response protein [Cellulomonas sp. HLT2-17]